MNCLLHWIFVFTLIVSPIAESNLIITRVRRRIDLSSYIVRVYSSLELKNLGPEESKNCQLAFSRFEGNTLAFMKVQLLEGKLKKPGPVLLTVYSMDLIEESNFTTYYVTLPKGLRYGETVNLGVFVVFMDLVKPLPSQFQILEYVSSLYFVSPYPVKLQTVIFRLPGPIKFYSKHPSLKKINSQLKYGPFRMKTPFSFSPIVLKYESNNSFSVANELVREINVSNSKKVIITEKYTLSSWSSTLKDGSFRTIAVKLPFGAHSVSTNSRDGRVHKLNSNRIEVKMLVPSFGDHKASFTISYSLPKSGYCYPYVGGMVLNMTYSCHFDDILIEKLVVKIVFSKGSEIVDVLIPFPYNQSVLDARPMVVFSKDNFVREHNNYFQVFFKSNDFSISKDSIIFVLVSILVFVAAAYFLYAQTNFRKRNKLQETMMNVRTIFHRYEEVHESFQIKLQESRNVEHLEVARKAASQEIEALTKNLNSSLRYLRSCPQAATMLPRVEELIRKENNIQGMENIRYSTAVQLAQNWRHKGRDNSKARQQQQQLTSLMLQAKALLDAISDI